jgi:predicted Zn-dependent protease
VLKSRSFSRFFGALTALAILFVPMAEAQQKKRPALIRDAEIEGLLRQYTKPLFKAAKINPDAVKVYLIADDSINAFVAGGQRIFINTGLFTKSRNANEVIGVLAHETGHIEGGHLSRLNNEMGRASTERIIGMLLGAAAMVGAAAAKSPDASKIGAGVMMGTQGIAQRNFLSYQRSMEASADQSALRYLRATKQNPQGMLTLFEKLASDNAAVLANADPYMFSHPMPLDRIRNLEIEARKSPYFGVPLSDGQTLRYDLVKAKLAGFMQSSQKVFQLYPTKDDSLPARYARSIAMMQRGDLKNAIPIMDELTAEVPENPYFWELKAQALHESGKSKAALPAILQARKLLPNNGLLQIMHAQILLGTDSTKAADEALKLLILAKKTEGDQPQIYKFQAQAYAFKGDIARAELATAEFAWSTGDKQLAIEKARVAAKRFKKGTPEWLRANDLLNAASRKKS